MVFFSKTIVVQMVVDFPPKHSYQYHHNSKLFLFLKESNVLQTVSFWKDLCHVL